jgi:hypothetical protein
MEISIIIVNYQSEVFLKKCLDSLRKNIPTELAEVIVVNNDPVALSLAADYNFFNLRIINQIANVGFAQACNAGAAIANGKFLFFLNPDTELNFSNIYDLIAKLAEPGVGIVAPKLITPKEEAQPWSAGLDINLWSVLKNNIRPSQSKRFWQNNSASQAAWVSGAAMLISKKLFDLCNGFDEKFFMYFEDIDLCKRVRAQGQQILRLPQFSVLHIGSQSYCESKKQKEQYYTSQDYYFKKHFGFCSLFLLRSLRSLMLLCKKS